MFSIFQFLLLFVCLPCLVTVLDAKCGPGWTYVSQSNKCVRHYDQAGNWSQSQDFCRKLHQTGTLLSLHSVADYKVAKELKTNQNFAWIGLVRVWASNIGSRRMWVDKTKLDWEGPQAPDVPSNGSGDTRNSVGNTGNGFGNNGGGFGNNNGGFGNNNGGFGNNNGGFGNNNGGFGNTRGHFGHTRGGVGNFRYPGIPYDITHCWGMDTDGWLQAYDCSEYWGQTWSDGALCSYVP